jgi:hypothetical protein
MGADRLLHDLAVDLVTAGAALAEIGHLSEVAVDAGLHKSPDGGEGTGKNPTDRASRCRLGDYAGLSGGGSFLTCSAVVRPDRWSA